MHPSPATQEPDIHPSPSTQEPDMHPSPAAQGSNIHPSPATQEPDMHPSSTTQEPDMHPNPAREPKMPNTYFHHLGDHEEEEGSFLRSFTSDVTAVSSFVGADPPSRIYDIYLSQCYFFSLLIRMVTFFKFLITAK